MPTEKRSVSTGFKRGFMRRCPNCGEGALFSGYLKVEPTCSACGHDNGAYRADDGPAYVTMLIIGHIVIAPILAFPIVSTGNPLLILAIGLPLIAASTLALLAYVKGGFIGVQWATRATTVQ